MDSRGRGKGLTELTIDEMAHMVANSELKKNDKEYFTGVLYQKSLKNFKKTVNSFFLDRKYSSRGFDENDLLSAYSLSVTSTNFIVISIKKNAIEKAITEAIIISTVIYPFLFNFFILFHLQCVVVIVTTLF